MPAWESSRPCPQEVSLAALTWPGAAAAAPAVTSAEPAKEEEKPKEEEEDEVADMGDLFGGDDDY